MTDKTKALVEAAKDAVRFLDYYVNDRTSFIGGGMPKDSLVKLQEALTAFEQPETLLGSAWDEFKKINDERLRKLESGIDSSNETLPELTIASNRIDSLGVREMTMDKDDIRQLIIEAIESVPTSADYYISLQADAIMEVLVELGTIRVKE